MCGETEVYCFAGWMSGSDLHFLANKLALAKLVDRVYISACVVDELKGFESVISVLFSE